MNIIKTKFNNRVNIIKTPHYAPLFSVIGNFIVSRKDYIIDIAD